MGNPDDGWRSPEVPRAVFNALGFVDRVKSGELRAVVFQHKQRQPVWSPEPLYRQMVRYIDGDVVVAVVNQWVREDGTLAASGRPDPRWIYAGEKIYWNGARPK